MRKNLIFTIVLLIPIFLIGVSIYNKDLEHIERSFYFLLSIYAAYITSTFKEFKNINIDKKTKRNTIILFLISLISIVIFSYLDKFYIGYTIASLLGIFSIIKLFSYKG